MKNTQDVTEHSAADAVEEINTRQTEEEWEKMMYDQFIMADGGPDAEFGHRNLYRI